MVARHYLTSSSFGGCQVKSRERRTKGDASVRDGVTACYRVIPLIAWLATRTGELARRLAFDYNR